MEFLMNNFKKFVISSSTLTASMLLFTTAILLFIFSCEEKVEKPDDSMAFAEKLTCEGCHTNQEILEQLAPGIDEPPSNGGGG
jgi:hypothetical protein